MAEAMKLQAAQTERLAEVQGAFESLVSAGGWLMALIAVILIGCAVLKNR